MNFKLKYKREEFYKFLNNFLPDDFNLSNNTISININRYKVLKRAEILGTCKSLDNLYVIECLHNKNTDPRIGITTDAFKIMLDHRIRRALIIFYNEDSNNYRLSFLKINLDINENNKILKKFTDAKRFSFYLGENAKTRTPETQLIEKGRVQTIDDLENRFSVEVVNKQFYLEIAKLFDKFLYAKDLEIKFPSEDENIRKNFIVRLLGRIIFCWFLKQKSGEEGQLIPDKLLSTQAVENDYYHKIIEPLFFEVLNTNISDRKIRTDAFDMVPYLNGGLFQPQEEDYYILNQNTFTSEYLDRLKIDDNWFIEFFRLLETYNFTIDENTAQDQELSIDPEMLGRIFENLLSELNERKKTGSFYTPREIVDYMVDTSLLEYLSINSGIDRNKLIALLSYDLEDDHHHPLDLDDKYKLIELIDSLRILDPACGSGAFPIGLLQKLVFITSQLDSDGSIWLQLKLKSVPDLYKNKIIEEFKNKPLEYIRKLDIIKNTIHGIDIQPIAVDVSRLRCFLTLIVESKVDDTNPNNRGVEALPNLDFKFVSADTLTPSPDKYENGTNQLFSNSDFNINDKFEFEFSNNIDKYFGSSGNSKNIAKDTIYKLVIQKIKEKMESISNSKTYLKSEKRIEFNKEYEKNKRNIIELQSKLRNLWESYLNIFNNKTVEFYDTKYFFPSIKNGFDIVIGNPPYIQLQKDGGLLAKKYENYEYKTFAKTGDIYGLFYEKGIELLKDQSGILCFITSNKWMRAGYGEKLRKYFINRNPLILIDLGSGVFESATVDSNILVLQNTTNQHKTKSISIKKNTTNLVEEVEINSQIINFNYNHEWFIGNKIEIGIKKKIETLGKPLKYFNLKINRGILTGLNDAFIIDDTIKEQIVKEDPKSLKIIKKILRGKDIDRYSIKYNNLYIISTGYAIDIQLDYPAIYKFLKKFENPARKRQDKGVNWWNLRACSYYEEFDKKKIVYKEISQNSSFCLDPNGNYYVLNTAYFITGDNLEYLLGLLNSKLIQFCFKNYYGTSLGSNGIRWLHQHISELPILEINESNKKIVDEISSLVIKISNIRERDIKEDISILDNSLNKLIYSLYNISNDEINYIESSQ